MKNACIASFVINLVLVCLIGGILIDRWHFHGNVGALFFSYNEVPELVDRADLGNVLLRDGGIHVEKETISPRPRHRPTTPLKDLTTVSPQEKPEQLQ